MSDSGGENTQSSPPQDTTSSNAPENPYASKQASYYALGILTLVYSFSFVDRQLLAILQESIKADLGFSDTQLGLLTGFAFALFYVSAGIPIARWADNGNRPQYRLALDFYLELYDRDQRGGAELCANVAGAYWRRHWRGWR